MTAKMMTTRAGRAEVEFKDESFAPVPAPAWMRDEPAWGQAPAQPLGAKRRDEDEDEDEDEVAPGEGGDLGDVDDEDFEDEEDDDDL